MSREARILEAVTVAFLLVGAYFAGRNDEHKGRGAKLRPMTTAAIAVLALIAIVLAASVHIGFLGLLLVAILLLIVL